ncbi:MFS transporter [Rhodococcus ruber]|uniref:MFS transporter n=1 Tax=Rhodococcus ruber TaxID=1830 RepID=UPI00265F4410|nr:MFS transporter [Rhodococcus ruber]MDO1481609.1 MFS transporter [Rhodococcus ruber]
MKTTETDVAVESAGRGALHSRRDTPNGARAWVIAAMLLALMMINFGDKAVLGLAANDIREEFGLTASQYGAIASGFFLLFSLSALGVGYLADRFSTTRILTVLAVVWALAMAPVLGPAGFAVLLASRIVLGAAEGPAFGVANHALQKWFSNSERSVPSAMLNLGSTLGVIVAAPALTWMIVNHGWRSAFVVMIVIGIGWVALWLLVGREGPVGDEPSAHVREVLDEGDHRAVPTRRILLSGTWIGSVVAVFAAYWGAALILSWLPAYLTSGLGYSATAAGTLTTLPWIAGAIALLTQGWLTQRLMRRGVSSRMARGVLGGAVMITAGICTLGFVHAPDGWPKLVLMAVGLGVSGVIFPVATTVCGEIAPVSKRGTVLGAVVGVYSLAGVLAPYIAGRLVGKAGEVPINGYNTVFTTTAVILLAGGLCAVLLIRPEHDRLRLTARNAGS